MQKDYDEMDYYDDGRKEGMKEGKKKGYLSALRRIKKEADNIFCDLQYTDPFSDLYDYIEKEIEIHGKK